MAELEDIPVHELKMLHAQLSDLHERTTQLEAEMMEGIFRNGWNAMKRGTSRLVNSGYRRFLQSMNRVDDDIISKIKFLRKTYKEKKIYTEKVESDHGFAVLFMTKGSARTFSGCQIDLCMSNKNVYYITTFEEKKPVDVKEFEDPQDFKDLISLRFKTFEASGRLLTKEEIAKKKEEETRDGKKNTELDDITPMTDKEKTYEEA